VASDPARGIDPEYPNLPVEVVDAWRNAPENVVAEIIDGELSTMPRPAPRHASAASIVDQSLSPAFRWGRGGPGGWIILPEPELRLGARPDLVVPDLAGWHRERLPTRPDTATIDVVPDWVCEVRSPSTQRHDRRPGRALPGHRARTRDALGMVRGPQGPRGVPLTRRVYPPKTPMRLQLPRSCFALAALVGCTGYLAGDLDAPPDAPPLDATLPAPMDVPALARDVPAPPVDRGVAPVDVGRPPTVDVPAPRDAGTPTVDTGPRPRDVGTPPVDVGTPAACAGGPLAAPRANCRLAVLPSTGDPAQDCVDRINQFRRECQCLPALQRWTDGEACATRDAMIDQQTMTAHNGFSMRVCATGSAQNECPGWLGWGSVAATVSGCLQQMWDEGPGDFYGPPAHGHYLNMSSTRHTRVACGFYTSGGATTAAQNFE
jgi:hypothetical protein